MRKLLCLLPVFSFVFSCQKAIDKSIDNGTTGDPSPDSTINRFDTTLSMLDSTAADSIISANDIITYEVITKDSLGWFGVWNDSTGNLVSNGLDSGNFGNPNYFPSGWKYSFHCPDKPFQVFISADAFSFSKDITINLYKNGKLIKVSRNNPIAGFARMILTAHTDSLQHSDNIPVLKYEVIVSDPDTSKFQSAGWLGQWNLPDGKIDSYYDGLLLSNALAMSSGWTYIFKPNALPFTMAMGAWPYSNQGGLITINFYVNNKLVKTSSSRNTVSAEDFTYVVQ